ncbi:uncharacterized protein LOC134099345 [Sardina pilchardus]|uniref:uncharacterized protein LOC134099345 n=1 Tax=Sardina pilchardus TaxID=27697 RepID=UPI002E0ECE78
MTMTTLDSSTSPISFEPSPTSSNYMPENITVPGNSTEPPGLDFGCIPAEVAFVVMASVGSLVVFLLASILVLACQVCRLQRHRHTGRHSRSNVDLVSGAGYWGTGNQAEGGGIVGPCDASVMLEEVKPQEEEQEEFEDEYEEPSEEGNEVLVTEDSRSQPGITVAPVGELIDVGVTKGIPPPPPPPPPPMPGSTSTETCLEMGGDLEGIPLVV